MSFRCLRRSTRTFLTTAPSLFCLPSPILWSKFKPKEKQVAHFISASLMHYAFFLHSNDFVLLLLAFFPEETGEPSLKRPRKSAAKETPEKAKRFSLLHFLIYGGSTRVYVYKDTGYDDKRGCDLFIGLESLRSVQPDDADSHHRSLGCLNPQTPFLSFSWLVHTVQQLHLTLPPCVNRRAFDSTEQPTKKVY